ncbi:MAG: YbaK/EbsC family protein [archaeon]|nr:YbaK/EbsC family protein [archaeon]
MFDQLQGFIDANKLSAKIIACTGEVHTAVKAAAQLGGDLESAVKSIVLIDSNEEPLLVVLLGKDKVDFQKIKEILKVKDVRLAEPEEVLRITGYEVGGVPPISIYGIKTFIDESVVEKEVIFCGGGDVNHLMKIKPEEILENVSEISIEDVKK